MNPTLRILYLEDDPADVRLVRDTLAADGVDAEVVTAANRSDFLAALDRNGFDLVLADYALPAFDGLEAMAICRARHLDKPFIFVTGAMGEDRAIETLRNGATDYVLKARLTRLAPAVRRALDEVSERVRRQQAQESLYASEERYRRFFEEDLAGDFIATPEGRIVECNPAFAEIYGLANPAAATHHTMADFNPEDWANLIRCVQSRRKIRNHQCKHRRPDGQQINIVANIVGRFTEAGVLTAVVGYVFDDTERQRAEEALRELNATLESKVAQRTAELEYRARQLQKLTLELSQAEEEERRRIALLLHEDLQQQIAGAKFHLSLVRSRGQDEQRQRDIDRVDEMLGEVVEKSRRLSHSLSPAVLHMNDLAEVLQWLANRMQAQHGLCVTVQARGDLMLPSEALAIFLFRAAQEILFNVIKHAHVREAALRVRRIGRYVCLSVSDQGCGFDLQELKETSGMGLFGIRERTEMLGGRMKVKSAKDRGSRLCIMVPEGLKLKE